MDCWFVLRRLWRHQSPHTKTPSRSRVWISSKTLSRTRMKWECKLFWFGNEFLDPPILTHHITSGTLQISFLAEHISLCKQVSQWVSENQNVWFQMWFKCQTLWSDVQMINEILIKNCIVKCYWLNYWHILISKGTCGFISNTLLIRIQYFQYFITLW